MTDLVIHRKHVFKIAAIYGLLGCALVLVATARYGTGLSADSVTYLAAAQNIGAGRGYINFDGGPVLAFPPLFSTLIAFLSLGFLDLAGVARFINALCFGVVVFLAADWLLRHLRSRSLALLGATSVLLSAALIGISTYAWSEPLFVVLLMLMFLQIERAGSTDAVVPWVLAGLFASLAILDRYAGITVVLVGAILLAAKRTNSIASRVRRLFLFLSIALLPISLWFYRNYQISSTITGYRAESGRTFLQSGYDLINVLSLWFLPASGPLLYRITLLIVLMSLFVSIALFVFRIKIAVRDVREIVPFLLFTFLYAVFMIYTTSTTALSPIDDRYMSPIYAPLMLSLFYLLDRLIYQSSLKTGNTFVRAIIVASLAIWLIYPLIRTYRTTQTYLEDGAGGFHTREWVESELIAYLRSSELPGLVYTNEPSAVYALTGQAFQQSPEKLAYESQVPTDDLVRFQADLQSSGMIYLVWFNTEWWRGWLYDLPDLRNICDLEKIVTRKDGEVYRMRLSDCQPPT